MDDHIKETTVDKEAQKKLYNLKAQRKYYQQNKDNPEYKKMKRQYQKDTYDNNPEYRQKKLDAYHNNKKLHNWRSIYNRYKRNNKLNKFIEVYPDRYEFLVNHDRARYEVKSEPTEHHDPEPAVAPE